VTDRLRIGYVYRDFNDDGSIASIYRRRVERLAQDEEVVAICSARTRAPTDAPVRFETVEPLVRSRARFGYAVECGSFALRAASRIRRLRNDLDVVHVVGFDAPYADIVTVNAVRSAEIDHYFTEVEPDARLRRRLTPVLRPQALVVLAMERRLFRPPYPYCLVLSHVIAADLMRRHGVPDDAIERIPTSLEAERYAFDPRVRARVRSTLGVSDDRFVVLFVGDEFRRKGLERLIVALSRLDGDGELWVAGGDEKAPFETLAASVGVGARVRFLGRVPFTTIPDIYSACDVLVLPSRQDTWGQPVVEAMAAGRVAVASEFTGAQEIIRDGENGFVVARDGSPDQIAAVLAGPARDPQVRESIGERAVRTVAEFDHGAVDHRFREAHHKAYARRLRYARGAPG
jgi:glycosyltransferase involved in cell wall biosynthesis